VMAAAVCKQALQCGWLQAGQPGCAGE
jgi:hypothetical protein